VEHTTIKFACVGNWRDAMSVREFSFVLFGCVIITSTGFDLRICQT
jgi:hypothetical protein